MRKTLQAFCILLLVVFAFAKLDAATKTVIEKDAQGNELKKTIIETDKLGNETTTIINQQATQPVPQPATQAVQQTVTVTQPVAPAPVVPKVVVKKELKKGSNVLYGRLGLSMPTSSPDGKIELPSSDPLDASWGTVGFELGATYLHFVTDYFALGAEFGLDAFLPKTATNNLFEVNQSTVFANFLLLTHIYLNGPKEETRFYIPIGIGVGVHHTH